MRSEYFLGRKIADTLKAHGHELRCNLESAYELQVLNTWVNADRSWGEKWIAAPATIAECQAWLGY